MFIVYRATSPSNKVYVGFTSKTLSRRKIQHFSCANSGSDYAFHRAIRKYGTSIKWEEVAKVQSLEEAHALEKALIKEHNSFGSMGYNMTEGGEGQLGNSFSHTDETKLKIAKNNARFWTGKARSEETKKKLSDAQKGRVCKPFTQEHRLKLKLAALNRYSKRAA